MWQPRGLDYPLYTVLSKHHAETSDFSLSLLRRGPDTTGDATAFASNATGDAGDAAAKLARRSTLLGEGGSSRDRGEVAEAADAATWVPSDCRTSVASICSSPVLQGESKSEAEATLVQSGSGVENDACNDSTARVPAEGLHAAAASSRDEQGRQPPPKRSHRADADDAKGKRQVEAQQQQQHQPGGQREQVTQQQQQQKQTQKGQGEQQADEVRAQQREEEEKQQHGQLEQQQSEKPLPGYSRHVSIASLHRTAVVGKDQARDPRRVCCPDAKSRGRAAPVGSHGETIEMPEACQQTTATSSSMISPSCSPRARPLPVSARSIRERTTAYQSSSERSFCGCRVCDDELHVAPAEAGILPSVPATAAASATSGAARGTRGDALYRAHSLRRPVVPSFRVLILFGSTSGVSAAVAFSIFHTVVHRLLSSSNRMQGGYLQDRASTSPTAAVSPTAAASTRGAAADVRSPSARSEEAASVCVRLARSSSPRAAHRGERSVVSPSESVFAAVSERDETNLRATARSQTHSFVSVEPAAPSPSCDRTQRPSSRECTELAERNTTEVGASTHSTTATGKESGLSEGLNYEGMQRPRRDVQSARLRERKDQQNEHDGTEQRRPAREEQKEKGSAREEGSSQGQRQQVQRGNGQQHTPQEDQQQGRQQNIGTPHRQSLEGEKSPASVHCVFPDKAGRTSRKREAAAQAAEVASMGLKAAAAIASAALKVGEQHDAARRAAAAASERRSCSEEQPKMWFLDEVQVGRVGVFIQSMQYVTFEDFLQFIEESRKTSIAATAAATREAADTCGTGHADSSLETEAAFATFLLAGATDAVRTPLSQAVDDAGARGCLCGSSLTCHTTTDANRGGCCDSASALGTSGCCSSSPSLAAGGPTSAVAGSTTGNDVVFGAPHTLVLYCVSTNTGGTPPESAAPFFTEVLEAADDFRVGRGSLQGCCVAGVGCGSTDYPHSTFCKPARQLMTPLERLGAQLVMQQPLLLLTDTSAAATTEMKLAKWRQHLMQQVEYLLQATAEEDVQRLLQDANRNSVSSRQRQPRQQGRQSRQQQRTSSYSPEELQAYDAVNQGQGIRTGEENTLKPRANSKGTGLPVASGAFTTNGSVPQDTTLGFASITDSSVDSGGESASDDGSSISFSYDDGDDDGGGSPEAEASRLPARVGVNSNPRGSKIFFAGVGGTVCGGAGGEDLEDVAVVSDEGGAEHEAGSTTLPQVKVPQADKVELMQMQRGDDCGTEVVGRVLQPRKRDTPTRASGAERHAFACEGGRRNQQCAGGRKVERTAEKMIKPRHAEQLSKEGYRLIGSHSAVKLCRWTKSQLRGRGGCYKHTFYGITSSQCMEMTPSLACANKCVFCWRHHKNPVGTSWRWQMDDEKFVVEEAITQHLKAIKELKGMAEVKQDRLDAARTTVRHCALSLVGEPIMYPRIAALVKLLHEKHISTFMVTNAQFPEALASLPPVTQLYLSVDAANPGDLKTTDQPLFKDYWERFIKCMDILKSKRQRTVYRLTLVAGYNVPDLATLEQAHSTVQSEAHDGGRQETDGAPCPTLSDGAKICSSSPSERITLEKWEGSSSDPAIHFGGAGGGVAAGINTSYASAEHIFSSQSIISSTPTSRLNKEDETDDHGKGRTRTAECARGQDLTGRSASAYAALVLRGLPDFIEVKAATYAGTSKHSKITMKNIPWHDQVVAFCKNLCAALPKGKYELACEHRHSCCVLIAKTEFKKNGQWHTWINYEKFHELVASGRTDFAGTDYCAPTPDWATFGHIAAGFSPLEARTYTKGKQKRLQASVAMAGVYDA